MGKDLVISAWVRLSYATQHSIIIGGMLLASIWIDNQLKVNFYQSLFACGLTALHNEQVVFFLGSLFIFLPLLLTFLFSAYREIWSFIKIFIYRQLYPLSNLNKKFYLIHFNDQVFLLNNITKKIHWIKSWQTAIDLNFTYEWTDAGFSLRDPNIFTRTVTTKDNIVLKLSDFQYSKPIYTRPTVEGLS